MRQVAGDSRRPVAPRAYAVFFLAFALVLFLGHFTLLRLPYFWDEAGQFVPAALDILHGGRLIPRSTTPNIHPPGLMAYLAAAWSVAGFHPAVTRCALLLLSAFGALAAFLLAIELSREVKGVPAFLAAALLCASPLFFAQSMLAQLDAPAMLFTTLALLFFLQERLGLSVAACVALVLVKETGAVVPLVFGAWLAHERRWRDAFWFAIPIAALAAWIAALARVTGHWAGNPEFEWYNVTYAARPLRLAVTLARRVYYLGFANLHWIGAAAIVYAWRRSRMFHTRSWRVAWLVLAAHVAAVSILGGAALERYLLPVMPILYAAMAAALTLWRGALRLAASAALVAGAAAAIFINPPYPFPYDNNLAFADFLRLHADAAGYLQTWYPSATVRTAWPLSAELANPNLGFVERPLAVQALPDLTARTLESLDWSRVQVLVAFSHTWKSPLGARRFPALVDFWERCYGAPANVTEETARALVPFRSAARFERRGQWVDIYVNPALTPERPLRVMAGGEGAVQSADRQELAQQDQFQLPVFRRAARRHGN